MERIFLDIAVIVGCSAVLAWGAAILRQPIIIAYVICGVLLGPGGFGAVTDTDIIQGISQIGVTLLLFIAGLVLHPQRLLQLYRSTAVLILGGCLVAWLLVFGFLLPWGFSFSDCAVAGLALMFSSTILITKLMPATTLHQRHMGSVAIAVLIAQDIVAVSVLVALTIPAGGLTVGFGTLLLKVGLLAAAIFVGEQFLLRRMMRLADRFREVLMLLCLGWCLTSAVCAELVGLTYEVGALLAGVAMARHKISLVLSEELKPVRDFFLVLFFFVLGAKLDLPIAGNVWLPALLLTAIIVISRPMCYRWLLRSLGEKRAFASELGVRMGQASEFALIICVVATQNGKLGPDMSQLVQLVTILTMVVSTYIIVVKYPTPIGMKPALQKD